MLDEKTIGRFVEEHPNISLEIESDGRGRKWFTFEVKGNDKTVTVRVWDGGKEAHYWVLEVPNNAPEIVRYCAYLTSSLQYPLPLKSFAELKRLISRYLSA